MGLLFTHASFAENYEREKVLGVFSNDNDSIEFELEIADTDELRQKGLMNRMYMPEKNGMLFVWDSPNLRYFWMKNTYIPLDIIYIRKGEVVGVLANMQPHDEKAKTVYSLADMAVEINAGLSENFGIRKGWKFHLQRNEIKLP